MHFLSTIGYVPWGVCLGDKISAVGTDSTGRGEVYSTSFVVHFRGSREHYCAVEFVPAGLRMVSDVEAC